MTAKQIKYFGSAAQKAALKRRRRANASKKKTAVRHRRRTAPRKNISEIVTLGPFAAGNPAKRGKSKMAAKTQKRKARRRRQNPSKSRRRTTVVMVHKKRMHRRRRNPARLATLGRVPNLLTTATFTLSGAIGTRALTQMLLGAKNEGPVGYAGNAVAAILLGWGVGKFMKNRQAATAVTIGGFVGLTLRLLQDLTPLGKFVNLQLAGVGRRGDMGVLAMSDVFECPRRVAAPAGAPGNGGAKPAGMGCAPSTYAGSVYGR
jgi:hypothetical protein